MNKKQGIHASIYIPANLVNKWKSITEKSKLVQEAIENA